MREDGHCSIQAHATLPLHTPEFSACLTVCESLLMIPAPHTHTHTGVKSRLVFHTPSPGGFLVLKYFFFSPSAASKFFPQENSSNF